MNLFTAKLRVSGERSVSLVWALSLAGKDVEKWGEKHCWLILAKKVRRQMEDVEVWTFSVKGWWMLSAEGKTLALPINHSLHQHHLVSSQTNFFGLNSFLCQIKEKEMAFLDLSGKEFGDYWSINNGVYSCAICPARPGVGGLVGIVCSHCWTSLKLFHSYAREKCHNSRVSIYGFHRRDHRNKKQKI